MTTPASVVLVLVGGAVGAPLRYLADLMIQSRHDTLFPFGTFTVNVVGSLVLGGTAGAAAAGSLPGWAATLVGAGFCGSLTTFSTFGFETVRLVEEGSYLEATLNVVVSLAVGLAACAGGWAAIYALVS